MLGHCLWAIERDLGQSPAVDRLEEFAAAQPAILQVLARGAGGHVGGN